MQFGTIVLSKEKSLRSNYMMIDGRHREVTLIKEAMFIYERPDNKKMIIEIEKSLLEDSPGQLFPLNHASAEYFKTLIKQRYDDKQNQIRLEIDTFVANREVEEEKVRELELNIQKVEEKNKIAFSENRAKTIRQLSKSLRKHQHRIEGTSQVIKEKESKIVDYEKSKQYSLELADKDMKKYL
jgi:hypothetical protein